MRKYFYVFLVACFSLASIVSLFGFSNAAVPAADFYATPTTGPASLSVQFNDTSSGTPTGWLWTFGDGSTSTDQNPTHIYTNVGSYAITLIASNTDGASTTTKTGYILVTSAIPPLFYSTFIGGSGTEEGFAIALDTAGNAYITGKTTSPEFPTTTGVIDTTYAGNTDVFITKLNADGSDLVYSTFIGGSDWEEAYGIAVDTAGNAYITGETKSADFPTTPGSFDTTYLGSDTSEGGDAFVSKLNADGTSLVYSTFLGGIKGDEGTSISIDNDKNAYIAGFTSSPDFPISSSAVQTTKNANSDAFVTKLNAAGSALVYSTFLGGSGFDYGYGLALDSAGNTYITGYTFSDASTTNDFPTTSGAYDTTYNGGDSDIFLTKLNASGSGLIYSTFIGGNGLDLSNAVAIDNAGNAYITGYTGSANFPVTSGAFDTVYNGGYCDAFVTKVNAAGSSLAYSTFLGGDNLDYGYSVIIDNTGDAYIIGGSNSSGFPTTIGSLDTTNEPYDYDVVVSKLNPAGSSLIYSTFLGGTGEDRGYGIALDNNGIAYVCGGTRSSDFPTTAGAYDTTEHGDFDVFVSKLSLIPVPVANFYALPLSVLESLPVNFYDTSTNNPTEWNWNFGDDETSLTQNPVHTYLDAGSYTVTLIVSNAYGASTMTKLNYINVFSSDTIPPTGSIVINNGAAYTNSTSVTLTLTASDAISGVTTMRFSTDSISWSGWEPFKTTRGKYLTAGDGTKYVYVQYKDKAGNVSIPYFDTIILETVVPTGSVIINSGAAYTNSTISNLTLSATDNLSGVTTMRFSTDSISWSAWELYKTARGKYLTPGAGTKYVYVQYQDKAGNISIPYFDTIVLETTAPTGSIIINNGAPYTNSTMANLTLSASDALSGVTTMRFSTDSISWSNWEPFKTTRGKYLTPGAGTKYVYVQYQDRAGNISIPYFDTIVLETTAPTGSIIINSGAAYTNSTIIALTLSATDAVSGVTTMRFSTDNISWSNWEPYKTWRSKYLTSGDGTKYVYVQYQDRAGNISNAYSDTIILDTAGPTGSILINSGALYTTSTVVTLTLSATDTWSGVSSMRLSNDIGTTWSIWESYKTTRSKYLTAGAGTKTVTVQYKDGIGNQSALYTDSIILQ